MKIAVLLLAIGVIMIGCIIPESIEVSPSNSNNRPPVITSFSPKEGYVIMNFGDEKLFSIDNVEDEEPNNLNFLWKLNGEENSDGTFVRIIAPNISKIMELEVIVNDGQYEDMVRWTIIVGSP